MWCFSPSVQQGLGGELKKRRGTAPHAPEAAQDLLNRGPLSSRSQPGVSPGSLRGGLWDTSGRLFEVPEGVCLIQNGVYQKSDAKVPYFSLHGPISGISAVLRELVFHVTFVTPASSIVIFENIANPS